MAVISAKGRCLCGQLQIEVNGEPVAMVHCCCHDCQKASGTGHMSIARFREADVRITGRYATWGVKARSGNINYRHFCPECGGRGFGTNSGRPGLINVSVGMFEDSSWFRPQAVIFDCHRQPWDHFAEDMPRYEEYPPGMRPPSPKQR